MNPWNGGRKTARDSKLPRYDATKSRSTAHIVVSGDPSREARSRERLGAIADRCSWIVPPKLIASTQWLSHLLLPLVAFRMLRIFDTISTVVNGSWFIDSCCVVNRWCLIVWKLYIDVQATYGITYKSKFIVLHLFISPFVYINLMN